MRLIKKDSIKIRISITFLIMFLLLAIVLGYYYLGYRNSNKEQAQLSFNNACTKISQDFDNNLSTIYQLSRSTGYYSVIQSVLFSSLPNEKAKNISAAREILFINKETCPYIYDIFLYVDSRTHLYSNTTYIKQFTKSLKYNGLDDSVEINGTFIANIDEPNYTDSRFFYYLPISKILYDGTYITGKNDAICVLLCDLDKFYEIPEEFAETDLTIALKYKDSLISINNNHSKEFIDSILNLNTSGSSFAFNSEEYFYNITSSHDNIELICLAPIDQVEVNNYFPKAPLYVAIIIGTVLIIILLSYNTQKISSSIHSILKDLDRLHSSSESTRLEEPKLQEFVILTQQINEMLDRIEISTKEETEARDKLFKAQIMQQNAELLAYRNQINPHFLFNTLECMRSMAQYYQAEPIEILVTAMAKMFRYSLYSSNDVPFIQEIEHVEQFLTVTNIRFPDYYILQIDVSDNAKTFQTPSMLLQPIVENAIKHAFNKPHNKKHIIRISARVEENEEKILHITIIDNGSGMTPEQLEELVKSNHSPEYIEKHGKDSIGIQNIYKRIKLVNPKNKLVYSSKVGHYTKVDIILHEVTY